MKRSLSRRRRILIRSLRLNSSARDAARRRVCNIDSMIGVIVRARRALHAHDKWCASRACALSALFTSIQHIKHAVRTPRHDDDTRSRVASHYPPQHWSCGL